MIPCEHTELYNISKVGKWLTVYQDFNNQFDTELLTILNECYMQRSNSISDMVWYMVWYTHWASNQKCWMSFDFILNFYIDGETA